jgi:hypothetical protein
VDRRADVWAFGCCLYEALTGARAFDGADVSLILAAILSGEPDWQRLPSALPREIVSLVRRCLEKDPRQRLQDLGDARWWLDEAQREAGRPTAMLEERRGASRSRYVATAIALATLALGAAGGWLVATRSVAHDSSVAAEGPVARFRVETDITGIGTHVAVDPSGNSFFFAGGNQLNVYDLAMGGTRPIPDTVGSDRPFVSPDGMWVGGMNVGAVEVSKRPRNGGPWQILCYLGGDTAGISWGPDRIVFGVSGGPQAGLWWTPPAGGSIERVGTDPMLLNGIQPSFVEGRRAILFKGNDAADPAIGRLRVLDLSSAIVHDLGVSGSAPQYVSSGHLLWEFERQVWAARFDLDQFRLAGDRSPILDLESASQVTPAFAVSANGTLVALDAARLDVVEVAPDGSRRRLAVAPGEVSSPRLSPDGRFLAYTRGEAGFEQVWIHELASGRESRLAEGRRVSRPVWTPEGDVVYVDSSLPRFRLLLTTPGRGGEPILLLESERPLEPWSVSAEGILLFTSGSMVGGMRLERLDLARPQQSEVWIKENFVFHPRFSPDGRWVTYERWSPESSNRVYVRPFPGPGVERPVSVEEGIQPSWAADGKTLYFRSGWSSETHGLMAVDVNFAKDELELGVPRPIGVITNQATYEPTADGKGFIVAEARDEPRGFTVIVNLDRMLRERERVATGQSR